MARHSKSSVVDGFTALKAVRDAQKRKSGGGEAKPDSGERPRERGGAARGGGIGHTVLPTKHRITCYECEYVFTVTGRVGDTGCPKCHTTLKALDRKIDGESSDDIKTIGTVRVLAGGVIKDGAVWAQDLVLEGRVEGGRVVIGGRLTVHPNAAVDLADISVRDLTVERDAQIASRRKLQFRDVDVKGELRARIEAEGHVRVYAGGLLRGGVTGAHLRVDEGGGLIGSFRVEGEGEGVDDDGGLEG